MKLGHDQMTDDECVRCLSTMAYDGAAGVNKEPFFFLRDASSGNVRDKDLRADFMVYNSSVWERQRVVFFNNRILGAADIPSHFDRNMSYVTAMRAAVQEKRNST